jgi:hypothetical protein
MASGTLKKMTQVEVAKLLNAREMRVSQLDPATVLATVAGVLDGKKSNQRIYLVVTVG